MTKHHDTKATDTPTTGTSMHNIINSAKVEVDFMKHVGGKPVTGFIPEEPRPAPLRAIDGRKP